MQIPDLEKMNRCSNCGKEAIQYIEVRPGEMIITCMNCGAARHYTDDGVRVQETFDEDVQKG